MYRFALKIIFAILNKSTQYISFFAITIFLMLFLFIKQSIATYEDKFINSLKGLYPEYITSSKKIAKEYNALKGVEALKEIFVYSEEIAFSYSQSEADAITKYMNVRTYDESHKKELFDALNTQECPYKNDVIWVSQKLYQGFLKDGEFNKKTIFFADNDDVYQPYNICLFNLANGEKWLITSSKTAKNIAYMPLESQVIYTHDKKIKAKLDKTRKVHSWRDYIDYDDLGLFLLAKHVSVSFLVAFFIFLVTFMVIVFASIAKEFESSVFLQKLYGMDFFHTVMLFVLFFTLYISAINLFLLVEFGAVQGLFEHLLQTSIPLDFVTLVYVDTFLMVVSVALSFVLTKKYHRLPL